MNNKTREWPHHAMNKASSFLRLNFACLVLAGIGKGTADKIYEFCTTGTIQKLEEKRMIHS